jgi:integrase
VERGGRPRHHWSPIYRLLMLLGLRREELGAIEWSYVDFEKRVLNVPSSKGGIPLTVPLSDRCLEILKDVPGLSGRTGRAGPPYSACLAHGRAPRLKLDALSGVKDWRTHDLRRTMRSGLARSGADVVIAEMCLGHRQGGIVGVYDHHQYLDEWREALLKWEQPRNGPCRPGLEGCAASR